MQWIGQDGVAVFARFTLCMQWVYDIWFQQLSPDKEFPSEVR